MWWYITSKAADKSIALAQRDCRRRYLEYLAALWVASPVCGLKPWQQSKVCNELLCCNPLKQLRRDRQVRSVRLDVSGVHTQLICERSNIGGFKCIGDTAARQWLVEKAGEQRSNETDDGFKMSCRQRGLGAQHLSGNARTASTTLYSVTDWNWLNDAAEGFGEKDGGGASVLWIER